MVEYYLYYHYTLDTNELFYIGKGTGNRAWSCRRRNKWWNNKVTKHGFRVEIVQDHISEQEAIMLEIDMIALNRKIGKNLVNLTNGGEGTSGFKLASIGKHKINSPEARIKMSKAKKGCTPWNKGKFGVQMPSEETKVKISRALKGRIFSDEHRAKISVANTGRYYSPETRSKMSLAKKNISEETRNKMSHSQKLRWSK